MTTDQPTPVYLADYRPSDFVVDSIELDFDLHEHETRVTSTLALRRNPLAATPNAPLRLDGEHLELLSITLNGQPLAPDAYTCSETGLIIPSVPAQATLVTQVRIHPEANKSLSGLYRSRDNYCTQCEAEGFRRITYFLDRPDVMTRFTTTLRADQARYPMLLSNGNLDAHGESADGRHWVRWHDPSLKPCYLFALVAGDFDLLQDTFTTRSGRVIDLRLYLEKGFADQGGFALQALKKAMRWDEERFGREYDLDIYMVVAVSDFNMGAMENKGLNIFNTRYVLAKPETATDADYVAIEGVIGHEYFHNWTGNRITCRDWFQLTLKEGLTVFRDQLFTEDMTSAGVARLDNIAGVQNAQFPEDAGPNAHPIRPREYLQINNFYTHTVYRKGAEVIRMIRTLLGEVGFAKGMDLYFSRHDGCAVTTEDFVQAMEDATGFDLTHFRRWYDQSGTPELTISSDYDAAQQRFSLHVAQHTPPTTDQAVKEPLLIPLAVGLIGAHGEALPVMLSGGSQGKPDTAVLPVNQPQQTFTFEHVAQPPIPSLLRNFSAPVKLHYDYTENELQLLFTADRDPYSRYAAGQQWLTGQVEAVLTQLQHGQTPQLAPALRDAYQRILVDEAEDPQYLARLLALPSMSYLVQRIKTANLEGLHQARASIEHQLGLELMPLWLKRYETAKSKRYHFNQVEVGRRAIKNLALHYLVAAKAEAALGWAHEQFQQSDNMTDTMGALWALNDVVDPLRERVLDDFYQRWQAQPLVVNKWLALHASSTRRNTLHEVSRLLNHPAFDIENPNNVYALLGGFGGNLVRFHEASGVGYQFMAEQILKIDPLNPQVAARLMQPLLRFGEFDAERAALMKQAIALVLQAPSLSSDLYELAKKSLD